MNGFYNHAYKWIMCSKEGSCYHEIGHWLNKNLGDVAKTVEFRQAIDTFIELCMEANDFGKIDYYCNIVKFPGLNGNEFSELAYAPNKTWGGYSEVYADLYEYSRFYGYELPDVFVEFYE